MRPVSVSTHVTRLPRSAKHAPVTSPTYPVPITQIFRASFICPLSVSASRASRGGGCIAGWSVRSRGGGYGRGGSQGSHRPPSRRAASAPGTSPASPRRPGRPRSVDKRDLREAAVRRACARLHLPGFVAAPLELVEPAVAQAAGDQFGVASLLDDPPVLEEEH